MVFNGGSSQYLLSKLKLREADRQAAMDSARNPDQPFDAGLSNLSELHETDWLVRINATVPKGFELSVCLSHCASVTL